MKRSFLISFAVLILSIQSVFAQQAEINTGNLKAAGYANGAFVKGVNGKWLEENLNTENGFQYQQVHRDRNTIILADSSRGVEISINLLVKKIFYRDRNNPNWSPLYNIISLMDNKDNVVWLR